MTNSKRKRQAQYVRTIPLEECGTNFYSNLKYRLTSQFISELKFTFESIDLIHQMISEKEVENKEAKQRLNSFTFLLRNIH